MHVRWFHHQSSIWTLAHSLTYSVPVISVSLSLSLPSPLLITASQESRGETNLRLEMRVLITRKTLFSIILTLLLSPVPPRLPSIQSSLRKPKLAQYQFNPYPPSPLLSPGQWSPAVVCRCRGVYIRTQIESRSFPGCTGCIAISDHRACRNAFIFFYKSHMLYIHYSPASCMCVSIVPLISVCYAPQAI